MELKRFKALWGMEGTYAELLGRAADAGYEGIETAPPPPAQQEEFMALLERHRLAFIAQVYTGQDASADFKSQVEYAARFKPLAIVSHSAKDSMEPEAQDRFFGEALDTEARCGIPIGHETHRQRAMFTPWTTARLLKKFPELRITADFSHWVNVCESHLADQEENMALALARTIHIHGRIGYPEGPQVPHPAAPEYQAELALFLGWWREIAANRARSGAPLLTFTAEFGPPGYMPTLPFANTPVAELWEVNQWMTDTFTAQFQSWRL